MVILRRIWIFSASMIKKALNLLVNNQLNSSLKHIIVTQSILLFPITELSNQLPPMPTDFFLNLEVHVFNYKLVRDIKKRSLEFANSRI